MQGSRENLCESDAGPMALDHGVPAPLEAAWDTIRLGLRRDCGARTFDGWLKPAELGAFDGETGELEIVMPSQFMADWVQSHFGDRLAPRVARGRFRSSRREDRRLARRPEAGSAAGARGNSAAAPAAAAERDPSAPNFDQRYRFETFVVGKANEVAATAARTLATAETVAFNPLFIHGGTGRGKTHLLHAIGQAFLERRPSRACRFDVGRKVHGRVHPRAEGERHDRLQEPAALGGPAADRRRPVHRRQGFPRRKNSSTR